MATYRGARVAVLGATGFIGAWVARALVAAGARCHLFYRDAARARDVLARFDVAGEGVAVDLRDLDAVADALAATRPAVAFNLAGYGVDPSERDADTARVLNTDLVRTVARTLAVVRPHAPWSGARVVHVGSALEYGAIGGDLREDSLPAPTTLYGRTKLAGTLALAETASHAHLPAATARLFTVYGPGEHPHRLLPSLLAKARTGEPIALTAGTQRRDFVYVEDVADALLRIGLARGSPGEIINVATGTLETVRGFTERAARVLAIPLDRLHFGELATRPEEMAHDPVCVARLRGRIGRVPETTIEDGVARTLAFASTAR